MQIPEQAARQKERQAWLVILAAFLVFVLLAVLIPYGLRRYYLHATTARAGTLEVVAGTVRIMRQAALADVAANNGDTVLEGFTLKTDNTSRALVTLFDGSTVFAFENTEFTVKTLRVSRFTNDLTTIAIVERQGRLRVGVAVPATREARFYVETPHALVNLTNGSYAIEVGTQGSSVSVRAGAAEVTAQRTSVSAGRGQRSNVAPGQPPSGPGPAALDLVLNGDFRQRDLGWIQKSDVEAGKRDDIYGQIIFLSESEGPAVRFVRRGSRNSHAENALVQVINRDVSDFVSLKLSVDFRIIYQSLSGGGYLGTEYPVMLLVTYRDATEAQVTWVHGFYTHNDADYPTTYGEQMPADVWIPYEKDLLALEGLPKPFRILSIDIVASGWDYDSMIKSISILAE